MVSVRGRLLRTTQEAYILSALNPPNWSSSTRYDLASLTYFVNKPGSETGHIARMNCEGSFMF